MKSEKFTDTFIRGESSVNIQKRVEQARQFQRSRFKETNRKANADMSTRDVREYCVLADDVNIFLKQAVSKLGLSARSYYRVIKVARTIADLAGSTHIVLPHIAEALQYRPQEYL